MGVVVVSVVTRALLWQMPCVIAPLAATKENLENLAWILEGTVFGSSW